MFHYIEYIPCCVKAFSRIQYLIPYIIITQAMINAPEAGGEAASAAGTLSYARSEFNQFEIVLRVRHRILNKSSELLSSDSFVDSSCAESHVFVSLLSVVILD